MEMNKRFLVIDSGATSLYLSIRIDQNRTQRKLWLSQKDYILDLLTTYYLLEVIFLSLPLVGKLDDLSEPLPNSLPKITDDDIKVHFQHLVGSVLYLSLCTYLDLAFTAMSLG